MTGLMFGLCFYLGLCTEADKASFMGARTFPVIVRRKNVSAACFLMPARCATMSLILKWRNRQRAHRPVASTKLRNHFNDVWSVQIV